MKKRFIKKQMDIAAQIYELIQLKSLTQKELSARSGLSQQLLSNILSGHANPTLETLVKIEAALEEDVVVAPKFYKKRSINKEITITKKMIETFEMYIKEKDAAAVEKKKTDNVFYIQDYQEDREFGMTVGKQEGDDYQKAV